MNRMIGVLLRVTFFVIFIFSHSVVKSEESREQTNKHLGKEINKEARQDELNLRRKAKLREYRGGRDEEPLKVQASLPELDQKAIEVEEEPQD